MTAVLEVDGLCKSYGGRRVLDGVHLRVEVGQIHGLLGPNGAGKSTTLECVEGLRRPDQGHIDFLGQPVREGRVPARMGVQLQVSGLPGQMTVAEALRFVSAYRHAAPRADLIERLQLGDLLRRTYRELSTGQQRRLQLALAIAHAPALVILDEPTAGLDVATRAELHELLRELRGEGTSIILATHDMAEAETMADRITVIVDGQVAAQGTPREITAAGDPRTRISIATLAGSLLAQPEVPAATAQPARDGYLVYLSEDPALSVPALLQRVRDAADTLVDLRVERPSLEERFLEMTRRAPPAHAIHPRAPVATAPRVRDQEAA